MPQKNFYNQQIPNNSGKVLYWQELPVWENVTLNKRKKSIFAVGIIGLYDIYRASAKENFEKKKSLIHFIHF